jgi:hypothetical protein
MKLLLFDIDSVLVEPNGYWASIQHTVGLYARGLGYGPEGVPALEDIQEFEASGLTSEWDSCPLCVGALLIAALAVHPVPSPDRLIDWLFHPAEPFPGQCGAVAPVPPGYFADLARQARRRLQPGERPAHAALRVLLDHTPAALWTAIHALLDDTHDIARAPVTQTFQNFALGHAGYETCYGRVPGFESPSLLAERDRSLLTAEGRAQLRALLADSGGYGACLYTARPSGPPRDAGADPHGFSPEAEIAAELVGLADLPLIGFGRVRWLAARRGRRPDAYVKPSPVQALASIAAAVGIGETAALEAAAALADPLPGSGAGALPASFDVLQARPAHVVVFEDSERGAQAVLSAVETLREAGCRVTAQVVGIAATGGVKHTALQSVAGVLVTDVNAGIAWTAQNATRAG